MIQKLNRRSFRRALENGLGRAFLHVKTHGDESVREELVTACKRDIAYDTQIEGVRGAWVAEIVGVSQEPKFYSEIVRRNMSHFNSYWDDKHLARLASELDILGIDSFRDLLLEKFEPSLEHYQDWVVIGDPLLRLEGIEGAPRILEILATRKLGSWGLDYGLFFTLTDMFGEDATIRLLENVAKTNKKVRRVLPLVLQAMNEKQTPREDRPDPTIEEILEAVNNPKHRASYLESKFGKTASDQDIERLFSLLLGETRTRQQRCYLKVFERREVPFLNEMLFDLALSPHRLIRHAACTVLSHTEDIKVREFALTHVAANSKMLYSGILKLLVKNYQPQDSSQILRALPPRPTKEQAHSLSLGLRDVGEVADAEFTDCLIWAYENAPCSHCRQGFVQRLIEHVTAPQHLLEECLWDCDEETRELARQALDKLVVNWNV